MRAMRRGGIGLLLAAAMVWIGCGPALAAEAAVAPMEEVSAKAAICIDSATGTVVYEKNAYQALPVASVTKTMTLLLIFEEMERGTFGLNDMVTVSEEAAGMGGSQVLLDAGSSYPVGDLIESIIVASGNDASVAMAEFVAGSHANFVQRMNARAQEMGLTDAVFYNCTGLTTDNGLDNLLSAHDVACISRELIQHPIFFQYSGIWMDEIVHPGGRVTMLANTNKLLRSYDGCDGIKTGSTDNAGSCITASASRGGTRLIAVGLGGSTSTIRFEEAAAMLDYGFDHYQSVEYVKKGEVIQDQIPVAAGKETTVQGVAAESLVDFVARPASNDWEKRITLEEGLTAPIARGDTVGMLELLQDGRVMHSVPIVSAQDVEAAGFWDVMQWALEGWFG